MIHAIDAAGGSMASDIARLNAIAMNLANATTTAYKREIPATQAFAGLLGATQEAAAIDRFDLKPGPVSVPAAHRIQGAILTGVEALTERQR